MEKEEVQLDTKLLLITANVGSLFEDPERLLSIWLDEFIAKVTEISPRFLALHLQEVGGKTYEKSMESVKEFIRCLCDAMAMTDYVYVRIYMDEDFKSAEHFTALGNIYFGHKELHTLRIWNFSTHDWEETLDKPKCIFSGNIEAIPTKEKSKFPQHFFPECKWSRKGFMRTRWEINGTAIDLVNIHLFHDASNLAACEDFPSVYCKTRRRALIHTIERFHLDDKNGSVPFFLFGDFNFRCDTAGVVKELTANLTAHRVQSINNQSTKVHYRNSIGNNVLTVGKKEFSHADHQLKFKEYWLKKFDKELEPLTEILEEYPINFIPSYPFEEDPEMPTDYMSTRCPSWCDRILMTPQVKDLIKLNEWKYDMIGESVCMGDHKPIYLTVRLEPNKGTYRSCDCSCTNHTQANNNNNLASPVECKSCPYSYKRYNESFTDGKKLIREIIEFQEGNLAERTHNSSGLGDSTVEIEAKNTSYASNYSTVSINIINSDNAHVCVCPPVLSTESCDDNNSNCRVCHNIIKGQTGEQRKRSLSSSVLLSDNIIVNQIDTHLLSTCFENKHVDPYTPESNESHSPYPELRSPFTTTSSNSRSPFNTELVQISKDELFLDSASTDNMNQSVNALTEKQSKASVTPVQLKSRLEDLQRISMNVSDRDGITVRNGDVNNVEAVCPYTNNQKRNASIFSMCCSIH